MYAAVDSTITNCQEAVRIAQEHLPAKSAGEIERIMNVVIAKIEARRETKLDNHAVWLYWMLTPSESNQEFNPGNTARIVSDVTKFYEQRGTTVPSGQIERELQTFITRSDDEKKMTHDEVTYIVTVTH